MKAIILQNSLVLAAALFAGCGTPLNTTERAQPTATPAIVEDKRIVTDSKLDFRARIMGVSEGLTPGQSLKVQVELYNNSRHRRRVQYHFEWFDQNGMEVSSPATRGYIPVQLEGKESKFVSGVAPNPSCRDFRLKLTRAD